jgi:hypothetical protein
MDELHGKLITYQMITEKDNQTTKEKKFKESKKSNKKGKQNAKSDSNNSDISEDDEEVANFFRRLKKGIEKYRGNIPLIFF